MSYTYISIDSSSTRVFLLFNISSEVLRTKYLRTCTRGKKKKKNGGERTVEFKEWDKKGEAKGKER